MPHPLLWRARPHKKAYHSRMHQKKRFHHHIGGSSREWRAYPATRGQPQGYPLGIAETMVCPPTAKTSGVVHQSASWNDCCSAEIVQYDFTASVPASSAIMDSEYAEGPFPVVTYMMFEDGSMEGDVQILSPSWFDVKGIGIFRQCFGDCARRCFNGTMPPFSRQTS